MSRLAGLLLVVLTATSFADSTEPTPTPAPAPKVEASKLSLRVVKVMPESEQALLFDKQRSRHVLVEVGETIGEYTVSRIDDDEVTLTGKDLPVEVALAAPGAKAKPIAKAAPKPADPYAEGATDEEPADPYTEAPMVEGDGEPRIVSATDGTEQAAAHAAEQTIRATQWGSSKADGAKSTTSPFANMSADAAKPSEEVANAGKPAQAAPVGAEAPVGVGTAPGVAEASPVVGGAAPVIVEAPPVVVEAPAPAVAADGQASAPARVAPSPVADGPTKLSKQEVRVALTDFAKLAASIDGSFTQAGLVVEKVQAGSVFAKAGLVVGDVVTSVDGKPLRSIDDAADLYARAGGMKTSTVQIVRAGKPQTLRIAIQ